MKSLELENQSLHKGACLGFSSLAEFIAKVNPRVITFAPLVVENMRAALQKLESRVAVLEKAPAPAAVLCAKVGNLSICTNV